MHAARGTCRGVAILTCQKRSSELLQNDISACTIAFIVESSLLASVSHSTSQIEYSITAYRVERHFVLQSETGDFWCASGVGW